MSPCCRDNHAMVRNLRILITALLALVLTLSNQGQAHSYKSNSVLPIWAADATIYEVNIRQYTEAGTFSAFESHLPRLQKLGVKILWLMPIQPISVENRKGILGSPYSVANYKEINPEFGSSADLASLINKAHEMGFKVIIDWVANHSGWDNPWIKNKNWYHQDIDGNIIAPNSDWTDVAWLNYENQEMRSAMIDAMSFWVEKFDIDGFRADVASGVPNNFWKEANLKLQKIKPIFMLAEAQGTYGLLDDAFVADYNWDLLNLFKYISTSQSSQSTFNNFASNQFAQYSIGSLPMNFITNHDENSWNGSEFKRYGVAANGLAALTFTYPGIPLIYSGQEVGNQRELAFFEKDLIPNLENANSYTAFYTNLITLKKRNKALWNNAPLSITPVLTSSQKVISFSRTNGNNKVLFFFNPTKASQKITINSKVMSGVYYKFSSGKKIALSANAIFQLPAWGFEIYSTSPSR